eukprot:scaffold2227_cov168-Amphora_coffeaeformis.AAC.3
MQFTRRVLLLLLTSSKVYCLHVRGLTTSARMIRRGRWSTTRLASRLVDGKIIVDEDDSRELQPKNTRRCFDFPPYYYKPMNTKRDQQKLRVKISSSLENQKIFEREAAPLSRPLQDFTFRLLESVETSATRTRLLDDRSYGKKDPYLTENIGKPPSLEDIASATRKDNWKDTFWTSLPARLITFAAAYYSFPSLTQVFNQFVTMTPDQLDDITSKFGSFFSILYGTFVSLTLSILYERQRKIQEAVALEASLLVYTTRGLLACFRNDKQLSLDAAQCTADQIRTLIGSSRGEELMLIMYSDPYSRMFDLLDEFEETADEKTLKKKNNLVGNARDTIRELMKARSNRLSDEALALPPTHFLVLNLVTTLILISYIISTLPTTDRLGAPTQECSLIFGILTTTYVLFYNFASDLNEPFSGVYQVRRSTAATHMLEAKWLIANHPNTRGKIDFERAEQDDSDSVLVQTPGIGEFWFEKDDLYVDGQDFESIT